MNCCPSTIVISFRDPIECTMDSTTNDPSPALAGGDTVPAFNQTGSFAQANREMSTSTTVLQGFPKISNRPESRTGRGGTTRTSWSTARDIRGEPAAARNSQLTARESRSSATHPASNRRKLNFLPRFTTTMKGSASTRGEIDVHTLSPTTHAHGWPKARARATDTRAQRGQARRSAEDSLPGYAHAPLERAAASAAACCCCRKSNVSRWLWLLLLLLLLLLEEPLQDRFGREHVRLGVTEGASSSTKFRHVLLRFMAAAALWPPVYPVIKKKDGTLCASAGCASAWGARELRGRTEIEKRKLFSYMNNESGLSASCAATCNARAYHALHFKQDVSCEKDREAHFERRGKRQG